MNVTSNSLQYNEKGNMCTALEYLSIRYLLTAKDKIITLQWKNLAGITLTRSPRQASPAVRRVPSTHALMWCEEQGAVSCPRKGISLILILMKRQTEGHSKSKSNCFRDYLNTSSGSCNTILLCCKNISEINNLKSYIQHMKLF